jgi:uncharacterized protein
MAIGLIKLYQNTLSPDHSWLKAFYPNGYCRFYPSCSEYGHKSISNDGLAKGSLKTAWRILRCNPFNKGGVDRP